MNEIIIDSRSFTRKREFVKKIMKKIELKYDTQ